MAKQMVCSRCESNALSESPPNLISYRPGRTCDYCQLSMRHSPNILVPFVLMTLATVVFVVSALPWVGALELPIRGKLAVALPLVSLVFAVIYLQQLTLPGPKVVDDEVVKDAAVDSTSPR